MLIRLLSGEFGILGLGQGTYRVGKTEGQRVVEGPHAAEGETPAAFLDRVDSALADDANTIDGEQQEDLDVYAQ